VIDRYHGNENFNSRVYVVTKMLVAVVSEPESFQMVFSTQSAKDSLKRMADRDLYSSAGTDSSEGPVTGEFGENRQFRRSSLQR
jgi:hypothetical protein